MLPVPVKFFQAGYCTHPEAIVMRGGKWKIANFPAIFALIIHPQQGAILYDTGYSQRFFEETRTFPNRLYAMITPVYLQPGENPASQLEKYGINPTEIKYIIISHFHADHVGGLWEFPNAQFICFQSAYNAVKNLRGWNAVKAGFLPGLIPYNFPERVIYVEDTKNIQLPPDFSPFITGFDIFADNSLIAVELPGHATGQLGLILTDTHHQQYFLIADACWLSRAYQEFIQPQKIATILFADSQRYTDTLYKLHILHQNNPQLKIMPTHCAESWKQFGLI